MSRKKVIFLTAAVITAAVCALLLLRSTLPSSTVEREIASFVLEHQEALSTIASAQINGSSHDESYQHIKIDGLCPGEHPIVQFCYSGAGLVPSSRYYGFYYSPDGIPAAFYNAAVPLEQVGETEWTWRGEGDNGGVTRAIAERWYFYEAWF